MLESLSKFPLSFNILKDWMMGKIKESNKGEFPDEFKAYVESENVHVQMLTDVLKHNPEILFHLLDENDVFVSVYRDFNRNSFRYSIDCIEHDEDFPDRSSANKEALINGVIILEKNLSNDIEVT